MLKEKQIQMPEHAVKSKPTANELKPRTLESFPDVKIRVPFQTSFYELQQKDIKGGKAG